MEPVAILLIALALDLVFGEFPNPVHPVYWVGQIISLELKLAPRRGRWGPLLFGAAMVLVTVAVLAAGTYFLLNFLSSWNTAAYVVVSGLLLKATFSIKGLRRAALKVKRALEDSDAVRARLELRALVSRDTSQLDEPLMISATIESVAENAGDSFVAPLLYFLVLGVPGAVAYRVANTFDAMIGYHGEYEYLGKVAARLDDVLSFIPARLSALLIVAAASLRRRNGKRAWRLMLRDHGRTESPNAGWPMSAMAGALGTRLEKVGYYQIGDPDSPLTLGMISTATAMVDATAVMWAWVCLVAKLV
ncbi:MAG: cobalamin biosynthesis protein [Chloroflexi bacterium]|nr:cobalamin biosynthesis protein [Chloroflexota bacterium]